MTTTPPIGSALSELDRAADWLNSEPLTAAELRGHVVAVQFCTYSCINWIRTLPYVRAWARTYRDRGLVVVGAHAPEFAFERELAGVRRAMAAMGVEHPIVLDNEYAIWTAFGNRYWPALYVLDGDGASATGISARAPTTRPRRRSSSCWASTARRCSSSRPASRRPPTGTRWPPRRRTWAAPAASAASATEPPSPG